MCTCICIKNISKCFKKIKIKKYKKCGEIKKYSDIKLLKWDPCCSICITDYENGDKIIQLRKCEHTYHYACFVIFYDSVDEIFCPNCLCNPTSSL